MTVTDRAIGCLAGIATGDAIGKQTESLSRQEVRHWYPHGIRGFEGRPGTPIPRYSNNRKHKWRIGETTDDTERTLAVARAIITDRGHVAHASVGREMLGCTKSVHPGVKSLWEFHQASDPTRIASQHEGCGAAIRVAPVGILYKSHQLDEIVGAAYEASISTHGGSIALAAAAATAAAVASAIDGAAPREVISIAERASREAERRWAGVGDRLSVLIRRVHDELSTASSFEETAFESRYFPDNPMTIVPLALGLATVLRSATEAILLAANIGGDSDSVASIAGGILGAAYPESVNGGWVSVVEEINRHELRAAAIDLVALRH